MATLEVKKGLEPEDPFEAFHRNPCEDTLFYISKRLQTPEMLQEIFANPQRPERGSYPLLRLVSKKLITPDICKYAILRDDRNFRAVPEDYIDADLCRWLIENGSSLGAIPKQYRSSELCRIAVERDWTNLEDVPPRHISKSICECAVRQSAGAIAFLPPKLITEEVAKEAVLHSIDIIEDAKSRHCYISWPIKYVPVDLLSDEMIWLSFSVAPESIGEIPPVRVSRDLAITAVKKDGLLLKYLPGIFHSDKEVIEEAIANNPLAFRYVAKERKTRKLCNEVFNQAPDVIRRCLYTFPEKYRCDYEEKYARMVYETKNALLLRNKAPLKLANYIEDAQDNILMDASIRMHNLAFREDTLVGAVYYISDIHIEHQLQIGNLSLNDIKEKIAEKVTELVSSVSDKEVPLLIAGDVADGLLLSDLFYQELESQWDGLIISILGNHELWDIYSDLDDTVDEIIKKHKENSKESSQLYLLENELLLLYKGTDWVVFSEQEILEADQEELHRICEKSTFSVLGGNGFSGNNPRHNADAGLYMDKLSREEEKNRTERFEKVYQKVLECADQCRLIVLTHTPPEDWLKSKLCSNWTYICGHTHNNRLSLNDDGKLSVLNDNQLGYVPRKWLLKGFSFEQCANYDPFADFEDGIHTISAKEYMDYNRCKGINIDRFVRPGSIIVIKRSDVYMFFYKERALSILNGGGLTKAEHDLDYYYKNLPLYVSQVKEAFDPYYQALKKLSEMVKMIGGRGDIHGCIVDIDFFNHVYLDPYDGKLQFYYASDMTEKLFYSGIEQLLRESPMLMGREYMLIKLEAGKELVPKLMSGDDNHSLTCVPVLVLDRSMYGPSRQMRSVQYTLENRTIRFWRDAILSLNFPNDESTDLKLRKE